MCVDDVILLYVRGGYATCGGVVRGTWCVVVITVVEYVVECSLCDCIVIRIDDQTYVLVVFIGLDRLYVG